MSVTAASGSDPSPGGPVFDPILTLAAWWDVTLATRAPPAFIEGCIRERWSRLLDHARRRSPFYRGRIAGSVRALQDVEPVDRDQLMAHFSDWVADPAVDRAGLERFVADPQRIGESFAGRYVAWTSSGSAGTPGLFLQDAAAMAVYDALEMVRFLGVDSPGAFLLRAASAGRYALVAATGGHFASTVSLERLRRLNPGVRDRARVFSVLDPIERLAGALQDFQPRILATYPTAAVLLAAEQAAGRLNLELAEIWTGGEGLRAADRERIESAFACPVRNEYGASEFLGIAWECPRRTLHVNADWIILEPVDRNGVPVPPGVPSHTTLVTNLANRVQPLIRYDLGDSITVLPDPCPCGSALPAIAVEGRADETLWVVSSEGRTVALVPLALTTVIEDEGGLFHFQLLQVEPGVLVLRCGPEPDRPARERACHALRGFLAAQGLAGVRLEASLQSPQVDPHSGKLRRVIALGPQPARPLPA